MNKHFLLLTILGLVSTGCASSPKVSPIYKSNSQNEFQTECDAELEDDQLCMKNAREHCGSDFEVVKKGTRTAEDKTLNTLIFRCI